MQFKTVNVIDIRGQLPRTARRVALRPLSGITKIAVHHCGDNRVWNDEYDALAEYRNEANYHINKDWGGGYHGDGLMYHFKIARNGQIYWTRDLEDSTWHASNANPISIGICLDGDLTKQDATQKQYASLKALLDELTQKHPEFPADQKGVFGHSELRAYGNSTVCPASALQSVIEYRDTGKISKASPKVEPPKPVVDNSTAFSDVKKTDAIYPYVKAMSENGIIAGFPDGTFRPDEKVSRADISKIIIESIKKIDKLKI